MLVELASLLDPCEDIADSLNHTLEAECPLVAREGGFIRAGKHEELDHLRELASGGKEWIARYQAEISQSAGIPNLKVGFNKVFGYYLEVTRPIGTRSLRVLFVSRPSRMPNATSLLN